MQSAHEEQLVTGPSLEVLAGPAAGSRLEVGESLLIGRGEAEQGGLGGDRQLSRRHAKVTVFDGDRLLIEDLGSTNGTLVNGHEIGAPTVLGEGDTVVVGDTTLRVVAGAGATAPPRAAAPAAPVSANAPDLAAGGVHTLPDDLIGVLIARAPVERDWVIRAALNGLMIILAINFILRAIAVDYLDVSTDVPVLQVHVLLIVSVMPVIGNSLGFYKNFGRPSDHSPFRYLIPGFVITAAICTAELLALPSDAGFAEFAVTVVVALVAPSVVTPTMLGLRVRAALAAETRLRGR